MKCIKCNGSKEVNGIGGMPAKCPGCDGSGVEGKKKLEVKVDKPEALPKEVLKVLSDEGFTDASIKNSESCETVSVGTPKVAKATKKVKTFAPTPKAKGKRKVGK